MNGNQKIGAYNRRSNLVRSNHAVGSNAVIGRPIHGQLPAVVVDLRCNLSLILYKSIVPEIEMTSHAKSAEPSAVLSPVSVSGIGGIIFGRGLFLL